MIKLKTCLAAIILSVIPLSASWGGNNTRAERVDRKASDSLRARRYMIRSTMYGAGYTNVFDTYLSPQEYKGVEFRISRESMRMTRLFDGNISAQNFFQANIGYTTTGRTTTILSLRWSTGTTGCITSSASQRISNYWRAVCSTPTEDLSIICGTRTIRHRHGHTPTSTLREWLSGI